MSKAEDKNRRRHERVNLNLDWGGATPLLSGQMIWANHEASQIFDLSYRGVAVARPALVELKIGSRVKVMFKLGSQPEFEVELQLAWATEAAVGGEMHQLSVVARESIDDFLEDRLIGKHLRPINAKFFASKTDFTHWYHGPKDTNVFLWESKSGQIVKASIELDGRILLFEDGELMSGGMAPYSLTDSIGAGAVEKGKSDFLIALDRGAPLSRRVMVILSQLEDQQAPLKALILALAKVK